MIIHFEGITNARDLGGMKTAEGKTVRSGVLLRTGELSTASAEDIRRLKEEYRLRFVADFRDEGECRDRPDRLPDGVLYKNLPALPSLKPYGIPPKRDEPPRDAAQLFPIVYTQLGCCEEAAAAYRSFFEQLPVTDGAVLWHCHQGKDRTGVAAILLLTALGVSREDAVEEYMLTNGEMEGVYAAACQRHPGEDMAEVLRNIFFVRRDWLQIFFDTAEKRWGSLDACIREGIGVTEERIAALRAAYLE